ncbi:hypothetical protein D7W79_36035 [Corallococcus exercitus]|uniref:Outer membrane protein beta-barrel domain-containing protein n=2 Tax=Corallococcus exercitus TaxID=2316736 RepID=A0A3A8H6U3_9BACT|nr:hypothetical protein [Corallococcus exercitus]RKG66862.1 hypothetical protein D7W79_36035 [Corallococcus exercitus]
MGALRMAVMTPRHGMRTLWMGALLLLAPGCLSGARNLGAATTPVGTTEVGVSVNTLAFERGRERAYLPNPELTFRKGAGENWDWGGRLTLLGLELGTRHRLVERSPWTLSVAPSAGVWYVPVTNNSTEPVNLRLGAQTLVDYRLNRTWTLTGGASLMGGFAGPLTVFQGRFNGSHLLVSPGGSLGVAYRLNPSLELRAEAGIELPLDLKDGRRQPTGNLGLTLRWGRAARR